MQHYKVSSSALSRGIIQYTARGLMWSSAAAAKAAGHMEWIIQATNYTNQPSQPAGLPNWRVEIGHVALPCRPALLAVHAAACNPLLTLSHSEKHTHANYFSSCSAIFV
jgi:hypothetical protein